MNNRINQVQYKPDLVKEIGMAGDVETKKINHTIDRNELSDEQLENVMGGMSYRRFSVWRAETLNESR